MKTSEISLDVEESYHDFWHESGWRQNFGVSTCTSWSLVHRVKVGVSWSRFLLISLIDISLFCLLWSNSCKYIYGYLYILYIYKYVHESNIYIYIYTYHTPTKNTHTHKTCERCSQKKTLLSQKTQHPIILWSHLFRVCEQPICTTKTSHHPTL